MARLILALLLSLSLRARGQEVPSSLVGFLSSNDAVLSFVAPAGVSLAYYGSLGGFTGSSSTLPVLPYVKTGSSQLGEGQTMQQEESVTCASVGTEFTDYGLDILVKILVVSSSLETESVTTTLVFDSIALFIDQTPSSIAATFPIQNNGESSNIVDAFTTLNGYFNIWVPAVAACSSFQQITTTLIATSPFWAVYSLNATGTPADTPMGTAIFHGGSNMTVVISLGNDLFRVSQVQFTDTETSTPVSIGQVSVNCTFEVGEFLFDPNVVIPGPVLAMPTKKQIIYIGSALGAWCVLWTLVAFTYNAFFHMRPVTLAKLRSSSILLALTRPLLLVPLYCVGIAVPISAGLVAGAVVMWATQGVLGRRLVKATKKRCQATGVRVAGILFGIFLFLIGLVVLIGGGVCSYQDLGQVGFACEFILLVPITDILFAFTALLGTESALHIVAASALWRTTAITREMQA
jgi:hypothetical protein